MQRGAALGPPVAGPDAGALRARLRAWVGSADAVAVSSGTAALHLAVRALGWGAGRRGRHEPAELRGVGELPAVRGGGAGLLRHRPAHAEHGPARPRPPRAGRAPPGCCRCTSSVTRPTWRRSRRLARARGLGVVEDACEALGAVDAAGVRVGARGNPAAFGFYANKQLVTGEGGMLTCRRRAVLEQVRSERNQGRADDMDWLSHDRLGFNYRMSDVTAALGVAQVERLDALLAERDRVARLYRERLAAIEGLVLPCEDAGRERRSWFVFVVQVPEERRPRRRDRARWPRRASPPRPTCRASTSSRSTASGSASGAGSSRSPSGWRRGRWRCRSSRRWGRPRWSGWHSAGGRARAAALTLHRGARRVAAGGSGGPMQDRQRSVRPMLAATLGFALLLAAAAPASAQSVSFAARADLRRRRGAPLGRGGRLQRRLGPRPRGRERAAPTTSRSCSAPPGGSFTGPTNFAVGATPRLGRGGRLQRRLRPRPGGREPRTTDNVSILLGAGGGASRGRPTSPSATDPVSVAVGDFNGGLRPRPRGREPQPPTTSRSCSAARAEASRGRPTSPPCDAPRLGRGGRLQRRLRPRPRGRERLTALRRRLDPARRRAAGASPGRPTSPSAAHAHLGRGGRLQRRLRPRPRGRELTARDNVSILLGAAGGSFTGPTNFAAGVIGPPTRSRSGDFNGDSDPDLAVRGHGPSAPRTSRSCSAPRAASFTGPSQLRRSARTPISVAVGDFNGDSDLDLAVANGDLRRRLDPARRPRAGASRRPTNFARPAVRAPARSRWATSTATPTPTSRSRTAPATSRSCSAPRAGASRGRPTSPSARTPPSRRGGRLQRRLRPRPRGRELSRPAASRSCSAPRAGASLRPTNFAAGRQASARSRWATSTATPTPTSRSRTIGSDDVSILLGAAGGSFTGPTNFGAGDAGLSVAVGDFNGDSDPDLAVANQGSGNVSILLGAAGGSFGRRPTSCHRRGRSPRSR